MGKKVSDLKGRLAAIFSKNFNSFGVSFVSYVVVGPIWKDFVEFQWTELKLYQIPTQTVAWTTCGATYMKIAIGVWTAKMIGEGFLWMFVSSGKRRNPTAMLVYFSKVHQHGAPISKPVLGGTFCRITRPQDIAQPRDFDMLFTYSSSTTSHFLGWFIEWLVIYFSLAWHAYQELYWAKTDGGSRKGSKMFLSQSPYEAQHSRTKSISQFQYILKTIRHNTIENVLKIVAFMPVQVASKFCSEEAGGPTLTIAKTLFIRCVRVLSKLWGNVMFRLISRLIWCSYWCRHRAAVNALISTDGGKVRGWSSFALPGALYHIKKHGPLHIECG